jgi:hypothetical protein
MTVLGSADSTPGGIRWLLLRMAHQDQRALMRAGVYPSNAADPLIGLDPSGRARGPV